MSKINKKSTRKTLALLMVFVMMFAVFGPISASAADEEGNVAQFTYNGTVYGFPTLAEAVEVAAYLGYPVIYLIDNHTLTSNLTIPANQEVIIPTSDACNDTYTGAANVPGNGTTGAAHVTLTVPNDMNLEVDGTLLVAGNQQGSVPRTGFLTGDYGAIDLEGSLVVNGSLYARGEVYGAGTVTASSGGKVYQRFQIADWRGGNGSLNAYTNGDFPFNLYDLGGISTQAVYQNGASMYGLAYINAFSSDNYTTVPYMGEGGIINFLSDSGSVVFDKNGDRTAITVDAEITTGELSVSMNVAGNTYTVNSEGLDCPFGYLTDVVVKSGASVTIDNLLKVLPGCTIQLEDGANLTIAENKALYFYGENSYEKSYYWGNAATWDYSLPATLINCDGTVNVLGTIASSDATFANVQGFEALKDGGEYALVIVDEYDQTNNTQISVPFYIGTPITTTPPTPAE